MNATLHFVPALDGRGKWHVARKVTETAACGSPVTLDTHAGPIVLGPDDDPARLHPICCRRCVAARSKD